MKSKGKVGLKNAVMFRYKPIDADGLFWAVVISPLFFLISWGIASQAETAFAFFLTWCFFLLGVFSIVFGLVSQVWTWREDFLLKKNCLNWTEQFFPNKIDRPISDFLYHFCKEVNKEPKELLPTTSLTPYFCQPDSDFIDELNRELVFFLTDIFSESDLHGIDLEGFCGKTLGSVIEVIPPNDQMKKYWFRRMLQNEYVTGFIFLIAFFAILFIGIALFL